MRVAGATCYRANTTTGIDSEGSDLSMYIHVIHAAHDMRTYVCMLGNIDLHILYIHKYIRIDSDKERNGGNKFFETLKSYP